MKSHRYSLVFALVATLTAGSLAPAAQAVSKDILADSAKVDAFLAADRKAHDVKANPMASDEVFVRRAYLDIAGRIPTRQETLAFVNAKEADKHAALIDQLIDSEGYVADQFNFWGDVLRFKTLLNGAGNSRPAGYAYDQWLKQSLRDNMPYDELVRSLITAEGRSWENGAIGYYLRDYGMNLCNMATTTQIFLGTSIHCAQCHNHPFDKWSQMDFFQMATYQYDVLTTNNSDNQGEAMRLMDKAKKKPTSNQRREVSRAFSEILKPLRFNNVKMANRSLKLPHDYQYDDAKPKATVDSKVLFGHDIETREGEHPMEGYARWMTSPDNPRFTTVVSNRLFKKVMGVALIEPVDELTDRSEASQPELMAFLEDRMKAYDYDLKKYLTMLYNTKTYQRASATEDLLPGYVYHFPGPLLRRMSAQQIWDSVVTLAIDDPDTPNPYAEFEKEKLMTRTQWIAESVYDQSPQEFLQGARIIAATQKKLANEMRDLAERRTEAIEAGDVTLAKKLASESNLKQRELVKTIESKIYQKGFQDKVELVAASLKQGGKAKAAADDEFLVDLAGCIEDGTMTMAQLKDSPMTEVVKTVLAEEEKKLKGELAKRQEREMKEWGVKTADQKKAWYSYNNMRRSTVMRSSDLSQPAPRGHFLREFGQSDREVVDNANADATITQALNLLNGTVHSALRSPYSRIRREIKAADSPQGKVNAVFLNVFNRRATPEEMKLLVPMVVENSSTGPLDVVWTVLNTQQFLFIQ